LKYHHKSWIAKDLEGGGSGLLLGTVMTLKKIAKGEVRIFGKLVGI
jgi:hypothetical protein